ncbi:MAG: tetratricopeptide repeat protein [Acidobacteria bacterium]|nr:tetratricopeptide repeat protein [Acidobacteriota bacterium]
MRRPGRPNGSVLAMALSAFALVIAGAAGAAGGAGEPASPTLDEARRLIGIGRYADAEAMARRLLDAVPAAEGDASPADADALEILVESLWRQEKSARPGTEALAERALRAREAQFGPDDPGVVRSVNNLAIVLDLGGTPAKARPVYERALAIRERNGDPRDPSLADALGNLGNVLMTLDDYPGARVLYERALAIREERLGPNHPDVADSLNALAILLREMGDYEGSKPLYERALEIRRNIDPGHPEVARILNGLALLHQRMGSYETARSLYDQTLKLWEKLFGPDDPHVA